MDEQLQKAKEVIGLLLRHLPDTYDKSGQSVAVAEEWDNCWNELGDESQQQVKAARVKALAFLKSINR